MTTKGINGKIQNGVKGFKMIQALEVISTGCGNKYSGLGRFPFFVCLVFF